MRPHSTRAKAMPLLALLLSVAACAEEETATPPTGKSALTERPGAATESEPARNDAPAEGEASSATAAATALYLADFCQDEPFIRTEGITRTEALENCGLNFASNPGRGIRCTWNGEVLADRCDEATPPTAEEPAPRSPEDQAIADCWSACVSAAFPGLIACNDAGGGESCQTQFNDDVYACAEGCYDVPADAAATADDDASGGAPAAPVPGPAACEGWEQTSLDRVPDAIDESYWSAEAMNCAGASFRRFDARYGLWVGLVSCGDAGYRFFLSETAEGPYLPATDASGHGQDFCELVDPSFRIENGDDITSGGCTACSIGFNYSFVSGEVFVRAAFGERFARVEALSWGPYQSSVIRCATGPVECSASADTGPR